MHYQEHCTSKSVHVSKFGLNDAAFAVVVYCFVFSIANIPLFPVAPSYLLPLVYFAWCLLQDRRAVLDVATNKGFRLVGISLIVISLGPLFVEGASYSALMHFGRVLSWLALIWSTCTYVYKEAHNVWRLYGILITALFLSVTWFLLEITLVEPYVSLRTALYSELYNSRSTVTVARVRSGLVPYNHLLGYQIAALVPLSIVLLVNRTSVWARLFGIACLMVALLGLYFASQRSALVAIVFSIVLMLASGTLRSRLFALIPSLALIAASTYLVLICPIWLEDFLQVPLVMKVQQDESLVNAIFRLELQKRALLLVLTHPFGLHFERLTWEESGFWLAYYDFPLPMSSISSAIGVHNGYLGPALNHGVVLVGLVVAFLARIGGDAFHILSRTHAESRDGVIACSLAATTVGLLIPQAMTHNASFLTGEPVTLLCIAALMAVAMRASW